MLFTIAQITSWLVAYKYLTLFPAMILEGPIITVLAGFLASLGQLNVFVVYSLALTANLVSDSVLYFIGRSGRGWWKFFGLNQKRVSSVEEHFKTHPTKTLLVGKLALGIGNLVLAAAGVARMPYLKYIITSFLIETPKALIFFLIGFYFGRAYNLIDRYLQSATFFSIFGGFLFIVLYWFLKVWLAKYYKKL